MLADFFSRLAKNSGGRYEQKTNYECSIIICKQKQYFILKTYYTEGIRDTFFIIYHISIQNHQIYYTYSCKIMRRGWNLAVFLCIILASHVGYYSGPEPKTYPGKI